MPPLELAWVARIDPELAKSLSPAMQRILEDARRYEAANRLKDEEEGK